MLWVARLSNARHVIEQLSIRKHSIVNIRFQKQCTNQQGGSKSQAMQQQLKALPQIPDAQSVNKSEDKGENKE